ncbi:PASTA domain-containing protein [Micromonospora endophytica]|uniref:PASTA domain-containing protein n=1 Tax=Micromonospora endophytica TaxID=515350 RepID=A0A2W2DC12_9ACTN|nr:PASTA domain-containing protein [Micromonospora endophytica]PZF98389.1 PASTA domain-containing protein [Micromonospora endophytica]RIW47692.1 PASTA domain-containing protein [Micromonospora endophytica]BCJ59371.1 hypothetical protein Jiend_27930 [Micromonospora endophytica]
MSDDRQEPPHDQTRPLPPSAAGHPDETAPLGRTPDRTAPTGRTPDETAPTAGTAPLPPAQRSGPAAWSGRAEVPSVRPGDDPESAGDVWYGDEQAARRWWLPILWGIILLLLLGLIGVGVWLASQAAEDDGPAPQPTTTATAESASPTPRSPSPSPPTTSPAPAQLPMPPLVGRSEDAARALLEQLGLDHRVVYRASEQPPGTVIATAPEAGELVETGEEVTLVVAQARPSPSPTTETPTTAPTTEPTSAPTATATPTG